MCKSTARVELVLPLSTAAPAAARAFARASGCADHPAQLDEALLLITELVTNAVRYGSPTLLLTIDCLGSNLKVRVRDGSAELPQQRPAHDDDEAGRGLALVAALSDAWGVEHASDEDGSGKTVWFELQPPT
jgi:anti-sigma regulatory factor (Ser/Thr protein kinase)